MARKHGKRYLNALQLLKNEPYDLRDACQAACATATAKFDESIDVAIWLGVDPRQADQNIRGAVELPHGLGKKVVVAVFARADKAKEAKEAGADIVGEDDLVERVKNGFLDFDCVIATPDMMSQVGKLGKILGPKGLMPSPKVGTVTFDVAQAVKAVKAGVAQYKVERAGIVHASIGKASFGGEKIYDNAQAFVAAINRAKPATSKGVYLRCMHISSTMGPGIEVNVVPLRNMT